MPAYISMPGAAELVVILLFLLIPLAVVVTVAVLVVLVLRLSQKPAAVPTLTCGKCGRPNPVTSRFCSQCGQGLQNMIR